MQAQALTAATRLLKAPGEYLKVSCRPLDHHPKIKEIAKARIWAPT